MFVRVSVKSLILGPSGLSPLQLLATRLHRKFSREAQRPMHGTTIRHKVEVDQRALVDKILARYATDFGALRELVQNADDAGATEVEVQLLFAINGSEPCCIKVWNNGRAFNEADWLRVRKIAAGNPDESSVGLFGVGFFSVFALTDAPEIHSGSVRLRFRSLAQP